MTEFHNVGEIDPHRTRQIIDLIGGRWTPAVLAALTGGGRRYQELEETLEGVTHKVLTATLRRAERDGLITRSIDAVRVDIATQYQLTALGRSLVDPLVSLGHWVDAHWTQVEGARQQWNTRSG